MLRLMWATAVFLFTIIGTANAESLCRINVDPVQEYPLVADDEAQVVPDREYLVVMKGGSGKTYPECIIKPRHKDHNGQDVFLIKRGGVFTKVWNCSNPIMRIRPRYPRQPPRVEIPIAPLRPGTIVEKFTIAIRFWLKNEITGVFSTDSPVSKSRDKGAEVRAACDKGISGVPLCPSPSGRYEFQIDFKNVSLPVNPVAVDVVDGEGAVTFTKDQLRGATACFYAPFQAPRMYYPKSGVQCTAPGEIDRNLPLGVGHVHFVLKSQR